MRCRICVITSYFFSLKLYFISEFLLLSLELLVDISDVNCKTSPRQLSSYSYIFLPLYISPLKFIILSPTLTELTPPTSPLSLCIVPLRSFLSLQCNIIQPPSLSCNIPSVFSLQYLTLPSSLLHSLKHLLTLPIPSPPCFVLPLGSWFGKTGFLKCYYN